MHSHLPRHQIVLLGLGHTNAHILRMWKMNPLPDAQLVCVSNYSRSTYSGMLPGVLAGLYEPRRMEIDLVRLCASAGARLIVDEVRGLDLAQRRLEFSERPSLPFDALSIGVGSVPNLQGVSYDQTLLAIKPMQTFLQRLQQRLAELTAEQNEDQPLRIAVVGGGVGGVEVALCLQRRLERRPGERSWELTLVQAQAEILPGAAAATRRRAKQELQRRGVRLELGRRVRKAEQGRLHWEGGEPMEADLVLWAASAVAPPLLERLQLPTDERGFLWTQPTLQVEADAPVFAVGDSGAIRETPTPKAGVYAVRQGPVLWDNLKRLLDGRPLQPYQPQRRFLKLLNLGDGKGIAEYGGWAVRGGWCWKWKDRIDRRFMKMYQDYNPRMMQAGPADPAQAAPMRCAGCGGKVGASVLSRALSRLSIPSSEHVPLGLENADDVAAVQSPSGQPLAATVDFFAAPLDDPYLSGRLAALNAASDVFASGAQPLAALTMAVIPPGRPRHQEQLLYELLAGGLYEFRKMGATLAGGHTIEGEQLTIGYTMLADGGEKGLRVKGGLRAGDCLVLTKPLGVGVLLAAHMQAQCRAAWWDALLPVMLSSNQAPARAAIELGASGLTDVTGFGLAGHLLEMLQASGLSAELALERLPLLEGLSELIAEGVQSTMAPANRHWEEVIEVPSALRNEAAYQVLFDPQTCGGLLFGIAAQQAEQAVRRLSQESGIEAVIIGEAVPVKDQPRIYVQ